MRGRGGGAGGCDQLGVGGGTRAGWAWMANKVCQGHFGGRSPQGQPHPLPILESGSPSWEGRGGVASGEGWILEGPGDGEGPLQGDPNPAPRPTPGTCPPRGPNHTGWAGPVGSGWWGALADTQDQRSRLCGLELFSDFGGRMSQPSRQCCGGKGVKALNLGQGSPKWSRYPLETEDPQRRKCVYPLGLPFPDPVGPGPGPEWRAEGRLRTLAGHFLCAELCPRTDWY